MLFVRTENITSIRELPARVTEAIQGLSEAQLDTPYRDGGWSPRQVVHHIADAHMNALIRMMLILTEEYPRVKPYDQDAWAKTKLYQGPLEPSLAIISGVQARMADFFESLNDADWTRSMDHPERGEESLAVVLQMYARHGEQHVGQITGLRKRMAW